MTNSRWKVGLGSTSLRRRVTATTIAVFSVVLVAVLIAVNAAFGVIVNRSVTAVLTDHVQLAEQLATQNPPPAELIDRLETHSVRAQLVLADGRVFGGLYPRSDNTVRSRKLRLTNADGPLAGAQLTLQADTRLLAAAHRRLERVLLAIAAGALVTIAAAVPIAVRFALSPLDEMTRLARGIAGGRRGQRLSPQPRDTELGRTAAAFDEMLDALEGAERRAMASEENMRRFVADAAHELRTPLAGITAATEAVLQHPANAAPADRERLLMVLGREAQRAGRLVDDLLDLARIDSGLSLHPEPTRLRDLAAGQLDRIQLLRPDIQLGLHGPEVSSVVDAARIGQVLANVLDNACAVMPSGGRIDITLARLDDAVELVISDTGPGVAPGDRERIFDRLVRLDNVESNAGRGSGLGLPIARGIARAHGGNLWCAARTSASGAVFVLRLPVDP
jgi:two-component system OmpR family sensor kinase